MAHWSWWQVWHSSIYHPEEGLGWTTSVPFSDHVYFLLWFSKVGPVDRYFDYIYHLNSGNVERLELMFSISSCACRQELVPPLYELLKCTQSGKWPSPIPKSSTIEATQDMSAPSTTVDYIQQLILITLERLATSILTDSNKKAMVSNLSFSTWK